MKMSCIPHVLALAAALVASSGAFAATELRPLSESEMSDVYGRGLTPPALSAIGVLSASEQANASASATSVDLAAAMGALSADGAQGLDRQMAQQRIQTAGNGLQVTIKLAETMTVASQILSPLQALAMLGAMPLPLLGLPMAPPPTNKH